MDRSQPSHSLPWHLAGFKTTSFPGLTTRAGEIHILQGNLRLQFIVPSLLEPPLFEAPSVDLRDHKHVAQAFIFFLGPGSLGQDYVESGMALLRPQYPPDP